MVAAVAALAPVGMFALPSWAAEYTANPTTKDELVPEAGSGSVSEAHEVKFAGKDWYVIGYDGVGLASESGTMTLFLKGTLGYHEFSDNNSNVYADSSIHSYLESYLANTDNFTNDESAAVVARTLSGGGSTGNSYSGHVSGDNVEAKLWLLSAAEARKLPQNIIKSGGDGNGWWLRSPGSSSSNANFIPVSPSDTNDVPKESGVAVGNSKSVRAAMLLDLNSVIYSSETNTLIAQEAEAHSITVSVDDDKGSVDAPSRADKGETVRFIITPAVGYAVDTVKFNDTSLSPLNGMYSFTMPNDDVTISVTFNQIYKVEDHLEQDGDTYTIKTAKGWEVFCECVKSDTYHGFGGKTIKLGLDITDGVTVSAGIPGKPFYGTFDGCGHTLTVALNSTDEEWVAPFSVFSGSIKNLTVTGTVKGSTYAGGLTGLTFGGSIENVTVSADVSGSSKIGGITGYCNFGSLLVKNTLFNGSLQCDEDICGLIGWASENVGYNQAITIENCLFNGTYTCGGEFHPITIRNSNSEFAYTDNGAYYTVAPKLSSDSYIICAGKHVSTITTDSAFKITTASTCSFDGVDYYAEDTSISLTSSGTIEDVVVNKGAVEVTDNQDGTYSFTMPDGNVTVENKKPHAHSFTYAVENATITATCANSDGNCLLKNHQATLTIATPEILTYNGTPKAATVRGAIPGITTPNIVYKKGGATFTGTPTAAGAYTASITVEGVTASASYTITPKPVTITGLGVKDKTYDGKTTAAVTGTATINGKVGNDDVSVSTGSATFADANVGTDKTVTFSGYSLTGTAAGNYTLSAQPASVKASINKAAAKSFSDVTQTKPYWTTEINASVAGLMPENAGTLSYTKGTATSTGGVTVSTWSVDSSGALSATIADGAAGEKITFPVTIKSTNYADSTVNVVVTLVKWEDGATVTGTASAPVTRNDASGSHTKTETVFTEPWTGGGIIASVDIAINTASTDLTAAVDASFATTVGVNVKINASKQYDYKSYTLSLDVTGLPGWLKPEVKCCLKTCR